METLTCEQVVGLFSNYWDRDADEALLARLEAHLTSCPNCRAVADTLCQTLRLYHALPAPALPDTVRDHLRQVLADYLPPAA